MVAFKKLRNIADPTLSRVQDAVAEGFAELSANPLASSIFLQDIEVLSGVQDIPHGLGRPVRGFVLAGANVQVSVWSPGDSPAPAKLLRLESSTDATISLIVF